MQAGLNEYRFGRFALRPATRQLLADERPAKLGARAFDVLLTLVELRQGYVSKRELMARVWPDLVVEENNLEVHIWALRKILGADAIVTIPGRGYRFALRLDDDVPASISTSPRPALRTHLPEHLPPMIGRADEQQALRQAVTRYPLVTIVGAGGIGKTLLAQHLLDGARQSWPDGVCWVDLAAINDASMLVATLASALALPLPGGDALQALGAAAAPLKLLLALDNAELLIAEVARVVDVLLSCVPGMHVVVTSQVPLNLGREQLFRLGPLALPQTDPAAIVARGYGAIALFSERALALQPGFELNDANVADVCRLCRRLDGSPLAIELAAARVPLLGLPRLLRSLDDSLNLLTHGQRDAPARQQTLRAALEWSHGLLNEHEQKLFRRMAVFSGGCDLDMARLVLVDQAFDQWQMLAALGALVDHSLVAMSGGEDPRYRLLELPLALARERLRASNEEAALRHRHAIGVCGHFVALSARLLSGHMRYDDMQTLLEPDLDNARAAMNWALKHDRAIAVELMRPLYMALTPLRQPERKRLIEATEVCLTGDVPRETRLQWAIGAADSNTDRRPDLAQRWALVALALARELNDTSSLCRALGILASNPISDAVQDQRQALDELRALQRPDLPVYTHLETAIAECLFAYYHRELATTVQWAHRWLELAEVVGSSNYRYIVQVNLVDFTLANGDAAEAVRMGLELEQQWKDPRQARWLAAVRSGLSLALLERGDLLEARRTAQAGWAMAIAWSLQYGWGGALSLLAALEGRCRASARLRGWSDERFAGASMQRDANETHAVERAERMVRAALGDAEFETLRIEGRMLADEQIDVVAFSAADAA